MKGSALRSEDCRAVSLRCFIALRLQSYSGLKGGGGVAPTTKIENSPRR